MSHKQPDFKQISDIARNIKEVAEEQDAVIRQMWEVTQALMKADVHIYNGKSDAFDCTFCGYRISVVEKRYIRDKSLLVVCHAPECLITQAKQIVDSPVAQGIIRGMSESVSFRDLSEKRT